MFRKKISNFLTFVGKLPKEEKAFQPFLVIFVEVREYFLILLLGRLQTAHKKVGHKIGVNSLFTLLFKTLSCLKCSIQYKRYKFLVANSSRVHPNPIILVFHYI